MSEYTRRHVRAAWAVHAFTASGVFVGYLGLNAVIQERASAAILWLIAALILDGIDGPLARRLDVGKRVPNLNGHSLDLIIDYFTCTILPVAFLDQFDMVPNYTTAPIAFAILAGGAIWMARTDQETPDRWFRGFPAEWNMIVPTLYLLEASPWLTLVICAVFCVLTLTKFEFAHPVSVNEHRRISITFMTFWLGSMVWLAIADRDVEFMRIVLMLAPSWTIIQAIMRNVSQRRRLAEARPSGA